MFFSQSLGGAVLNAIGQATFDQRVRARLEPRLGIDPQTLLAIGATNLRKIVPAGELGQVLDVYNEAVRGPFFVTLVACTLLVLPTLAIEWKKLPPKKSPPKQPKETPQQEQGSVEVGSPSSAEVGSGKVSFWTKCMKRVKRSEN